jgi:hypothetical protein
MSESNDCVLTKIISSGDFEHLLFKEALREYHKARIRKTINSTENWGRPKTIHSKEYIDVARSVHKARSDGNKWDIVKVIIKAEHGKEYSISHLSHILKSNKDKI